MPPYGQHVERTVGIRKPEVSERPGGELRRWNSELAAPVGSQIGKFRIRAELGRGGMGIVYLAEDSELRRDVALKLLPPDRVNEERRHRFLREARAAARISHPNVITVYDVGEDGGATYIAMEYIDGRTLRALLQQQVGVPMPIPEALRIARAIAIGLQSAHAAGVVHRDLKPENVMLAQQGGIKILDFGLAKLAAPSAAESVAPGEVGSGTTITMNSDDELTTKGRVLGTPSYMSPEQVTGRPLDRRSDLFSFGVILYEMVTGVRPFRGNTNMEVLIAIDRDDAEPAAQQNPAVPAELDDFLGRCLAKRPEQRCQDASELVAALDRLLAIPDDLSDTAVGALTSQLPGALSAAGAREVLDHQQKTLDSAGQPQHIPRPPASRLPSFTAKERALIAVVLIRVENRTAADQTPDAYSAPATADVLTELFRETKRRGGQAELLSDGSFTAIFAARLLATDQAAHASRAALALRRLAPGWPIALVMGRGEEPGQRLPVDVLASADRLLADSRGGREETAQGVIALDELTAGLLSTHFDVSSSPEGPLLRGELRFPDGVRTLLGKPTPCVGRERELSTLAALFNECLEAPLARAVLVVAPPGMGKSRLAHEMIRALVRQRGTEVAIWRSGGDCQGQAAPLSLLAQALKAECAIRGDEPLAEQQQKLALRVAKSVPASDRKHVTEFLGEIIHTPFAAESSPPLHAARQDAELMNEQLRRAFVDFIGAETAQRPLLLVIEDLHWGDPLSVRFIDGALRAHGDRPWMVLALARPEVHDRFPKLWTMRDVHQLHLKELSRRAAEQLVRQVLGDASRPELVARLVSLADGQAFYLEELIRAAALRPNAALPATVVAMVQARLMELSADERRLLRAASVFGEVFWQSAVEGLAGGATAELLADLVEREFVLRRPDSRFPSEREYAFRHSLLREGAYAMLTDADLVVGHRLAAEWLELHDDQNPLLIAEHFERGERPLLAAGFYKEAATQASRAGDVDATITYSKRGLSCGAQGSVREQLLWVQCDAYAYRFDYAQARPIAQELLGQAQLGSVAHITAAKFLMSEALFCGRFDELRAIVDAAQSVAPSPEAAGQLAVMLMSCVVILPIAGQSELAERYLHSLRRLGESLGQQGHVARAWMHFALAFSGLGSEEDPCFALAESEATLKCFDEAGSGMGVGFALILIGMSAWFLGDADRAERAFMTPSAMSPNLPAMAAHRVGVLVDLMLARGDLAAAQLCASALADSGRVRKNVFDEGFGRYALAKVLNAAGKCDAAEREAALAAELLVMPVHRLWALSLQSVIQRAQGRYVEAHAAAAQAVHGCAAMRCFGYRSAEVKLAYAEALDALGEHEQARRYLATTRHKLLATAERIPDPALRRSFLRTVPVHARILELADR